jgi:hypothetical protein
MKESKTPEMDAGMNYQAAAVSSADAARRW